ncbi:MAG: GNAT family N-acetyltransferase [Pseudomonadota bacterium]
MNIRLDDLRGSEIAALLSEHLRDMHATSPRESVHALDLDGLRQPDITFWTVWNTLGNNAGNHGELAGCGALRQIDAAHGEIKSMRTAMPYRRRGVASLLLHHIIDEAKQRGYRQLSLETGSMAYFAAARQLYADFGFCECPPFEGYGPDPNSVFMTLVL